WNDYGFEIVTMETSGVKGLAFLKKEIVDVIFVDIRMPGMDGLETLEKIRTEYDFPIIMISGHGTIDTAVKSIKIGAYDFISKPFDLNRLLIATRNALDKVQLVNETKILKKRINQKYEIIGESKAINKVKNIIERVAPTDARVLIMGDSGTGKELVAHWLHQKSERYNAPFIEVNCAAIPSELIESELFGHEKGSFTSAIKQKKGNFELANGGTLFLDEIGDMSLSAQSKVLRALQENKITRVGGEKEISVNVRVIAATNKNLVEEIEHKNFREDLFHRLSVIQLHVPALKDRKEDIPLLVKYFINDISESTGKQPLPITDEAIEELQQYPWSGNIRELKNVIERLLILSDGVITIEDVKQYALPLKN
ncbi:MAG: sigma-54 dependent transcriptional regulator, partial [Bacteroidales bacterium]